MKKFQKFYLQAAGAVFVMTGAAKLISAFGVSGIHHLPDPIFGIPFGKLMFAAGMVECLLAVMCLFVQNIYTVGAVTAFSTGLFFYRLGLWWIGWQRPCRCLGELTDVLHVPANAADIALKLILVFLLTGGCLCLVAHWRRKDTVSNSAEA